MNSTFIIIYVKANPKKFCKMLSFKKEKINWVEFSAGKTLYSEIQYEREMHF